MENLDCLAWARSLVRKPGAHKGDHGKILLIGGAPGMAGALVLAGQAALYSGAGYTQLLMLDDASAHVVPSQPELMLHSAALWHGRAAQALAHLGPDLIAIGPGLGQSAHARHWLQAALQWNGPLVLDADALHILAQDAPMLHSLAQRAAPVCLTPHPGEAARLLQWDGAQVQADRPGALDSLSKLTGSIVVLKGQHTLVGAPNQSTRRCLAGNPGMATAGMGDVLTGCIAALAAQGLRAGLSLWQASCLGVQVHARAGDQLCAAGIGPIGLTPSELARQLRIVINQAAAQ